MTFDLIPRIKSLPTYLAEPVIARYWEIQQEIALRKPENTSTNFEGYKTKCIATMNFLIQI